MTITHPQPAPTPAEALTLADVAIGYASSAIARGHRHVVATGLNATLRAGELTCLLGPNGTGKSTLLRTLAGFQPALGGSVTLMGRSLAAMTARERARSVAVVLTEATDAELLSVRELVALGRQPYTGFFGTLSASDEAIVDEAMQLTGIATLASRHVGTLSDGERQKVMIARALAQQSPVVLLDEPTAFLDHPSKRATMLLLRQLAEEAGRAILLSTHDVQMALQSAHSVWLMPSGQLLTGSTEAMTRLPEMRAFVGNMPTETS